MIRRNVAITLLCMALCGCSKALTESSAVGMVQSFVDLKDGGWTQTSLEILPILMASEQQQQLKQVAVQRAIKNGYLQEKTIPVTYPNFSGQFTGHRSYGWTETLTLTTTPGRPPVARGSLTSCHAGEYASQPPFCLSGQISGTVQRNGVGASEFIVAYTGFVVGLGFDPKIPIRLMNLVRGNTDVIQGVILNESVRFEGHATGPDLQQDVYGYSWAGKLPKDALNGAMLKLGHLVVDSCDHLLLGSETSATATCKTHVNLTEAAKGIFGTRSTEQPLQASFGKKPNGTWVATQINYAPPPYDIDK
jgi:hypothetical protein